MRDFHVTKRDVVVIEPYLQREIQLGPASTPSKALLDKYS